MSEYGKKVAKKMNDYMGNPDSIDSEVHDLQHADHGAEVRGALAASVTKSFEKSKQSETKANEAHEVMTDILEEGFNSAALESNFEQKLDNKIKNLQPEWTQFKDDTVQQLAETIKSDEGLDQIKKESIYNYKVNTKANHEKNKIEGNLLVATFNIRSYIENQMVAKNLIFKKLYKNNIEVVGTQEMVDSKIFGFEDHLTDDFYEHGFFTTSLESGEFDGAGQYGNGFLSAYPFISRAGIKFNQKAGQQRSLQHVVIRVGNKPVSVYNTHLEVNASEERDSQIRQIINYINTNDISQYIVILGDFNANYDDAIFDSLKENGYKFVNTNKYQTISDQYVDNIIINKNVEIIQDGIEIIEDSLSDHNLLWAKLHLKEV